MKKSKVLTVSIGIPAFNEEANIGYLLDELIKQKQTSFKIKKIIVSSDGGDDKTVQIARHKRNKSVVVLDNKDRKGQSFRQNQIISLCKSDVLVLLNADVAINNKSFIEKMVKPIALGEADLVSSDMLGVETNSYLGGILNYSLSLKSYMFGSKNNGDNIYACHGAARALSKSLYTKFKFSHSVGEDAYIYLWSKFHGYKFYFAKDAICYIKSPETLSDHKKQSFRNVQTRNKFVGEFGEEFVAKFYPGVSFFYGVDFLTIIKTIAVFLFKEPIMTLIYLFLTLFLRIEAFFSNDISNVWEISKSSKVLKRS